MRSLWIKPCRNVRELQRAEGPHSAGPLSGQRFSVKSGSLSIHWTLSARVKHIGNSVLFTQACTQSRLCLFLWSKMLWCTCKCVQKEHFLWAYPFFLLLLHLFRNTSPVVVVLLESTPKISWKGTVLLSSLNVLQSARAPSPCCLEHLNPWFYMHAHALFLQHQGVLMDLIQCNSADTPTLQIAVGQVQGVQGSCCSGLTGAWWCFVGSFFSAHSTQKEEYVSSFHPLNALMLHSAVYIPFLFSTCCYFKSKQILWGFKRERVKESQGGWKGRNLAFKLIDWNKQCYLFHLSPFSVLYH